LSIVSVRGHSWAEWLGEYERSLANAHAAILIADFSIAFDNSEDRHRRAVEARDSLVT